MWILGGDVKSDDGIRKNDVWYSTNGKNWTCATNSAQWAKRAEHRSIVFDNKIWVIGGFVESSSGDTKSNDVWYSVDGKNWTCATDSAEWSKRTNFTLVAFDNKMWVLGGENDKWNNVNDAWSSTDGTTWKREFETAEWSKRQSHSSVIFNNRMWIMGGSGGGYHNDIWYCEPPTAVHSVEPKTLFPVSLLSVENINCVLGVKISYTLRKSAFIRLDVYNSAGKKIKTFYTGQKEAGFYTQIWNGIDFSSEITPAGIYFIRLEIDNCRQVKKALLKR